MLPARQTVFLSFADSRLSRSMRRLEGEVAALQLFDRLVLYNELDLEASFVRRHRDLFAFRTRGFGFFLWKPYLIERTLSRLADGDVLVYSDVGNHFLREKRHRFAQYVEIASGQETSIVASMLPPQFAERKWTKPELLDHCGAGRDESILSSPQFEANLMVIVSGARSRELIRKWNALYEDDPRLVDDSLSGARPDGFVEHRHDQSGFSILAKQYHIGVIPPELDDFVIRSRDTIVEERRLAFLLFLTRKRLLWDRLASVASATFSRASTGPTGGSAPSSSERSAQRSG